MTPAQDTEHNCPAMLSASRNKAQLKQWEKVCVLVELLQPVCYEPKSKTNKPGVTLL